MPYFPVIVKKNPQFSIKNGGKRLDRIGIYNLTRKSILKIGWTIKTISYKKTPDSTGLAGCPVINLKNKYIPLLGYKKVAMFYHDQTHRANCAGCQRQRRCLCRGCCRWQYTPPSRASGQKPCCGRGNSLFRKATMRQTLQPIFACAPRPMTL